MMVFVVDDEPVIRMLVTRVLAQLGLEAGTFSNADDALPEIEAAGTSAEMVITDVTMPGSIDGIGLAERLSLSRPRLPLIVMSGDAAALERAAASCSVCSTLQKPFDVVGLKAAIDSARAKRPAGYSGI